MRRNASDLDPKGSRQEGHEMLCLRRGVDQPGAWEALRVPAGVVRPWGMVVGGGGNNCYQDDLAWALLPVR